jgi:hypothetical protein
MTLPVVDEDSELYSANAERVARHPSRKCDFCGGRLGLIIHRYYRMRFCCEAHMRAYGRRLSQDTRAKIRRLALP